MKIPLMRSRQLESRTVSMPSEQIASALIAIGGERGQGTFALLRQKDRALSFTFSPKQWQWDDSQGSRGSGDITRPSEVRTVSVAWTRVGDATAVFVDVGSRWYETYSPLAHNGSARLDNHLVAATILADLAAAQADRGL